MRPGGREEPGVAGDLAGHLAGPVLQAVVGRGAGPRVVRGAGAWSGLCSSRCLGRDGREREYRGDLLAKNESALRGLRRGPDHCRKFAIEDASGL